MIIISIIIPDGSKDQIHFSNVISQSSDLHYLREIEEMHFVLCVLLYNRTSLNYELSLNSGALSLLSRDSYPPRETRSLESQPYSDQLTRLRLFTFLTFSLLMRKLIQNGETFR